MEPRRVVRCIVMSHDPHLAEAVASALHMRSSASGLIISAARTPERAMEWIAGDPPGTVGAVLLVATAQPMDGLVACLLSARQRHPDALLFTTKASEAMPTHAVLVPPGRPDEVGEWVAQRLHQRFSS